MVGTTGLIAAGFVVVICGVGVLIIVIGASEKRPVRAIIIEDDSKRGEAVRVYLCEKDEIPRHIATLPASTAFGLESLFTEMNIPVKRLEKTY